MNDSVVTFCSALSKKFADTTQECEDIKIHIRVDIFQDHSSRLILALDGCGINSPGDENAIRSVCPRLKDLDLSHNFLSEWIHVIQIISQLQSLKFLNLSHNPLYLSQSLGEVHNKHNTLQSLVLNNTKINFDALCKILEICPCLEELHLSLNEYETVPIIDQQFKNIKSLHFSSNNIKSWYHVQNLAHIFTSLTKLILSENDIDSVSSVGDEFPYLEYLSLSNTQINDWNSLDNLRTFSKLKEIRLNSIPLLNGFKKEKERVFLLMNWLPHVFKINGSILNESERDDAERYFIRYYKDKVEKPSRYHEIVKLRGDLCDLADVKLGKRDIVSLLITGDVEQSFEVEFDTLTLTRDVYKTVSQICNLNLKQFRLLLKEKENNKIYDSDKKYEYMSIPNVTVMFPREGRYLYMYHPKNGDEIELQRLDFEN
ncbi:tubulin-specific chaperone cofactor E-like protein isoform X3 [Hydra vulgaris]|uniref:Tubulin-specific chaperone cofactor E-like protein isoform X3 n=1 Tax=Hydra vulgaris TaxID=6087 RepID=A0ABM4BMC6_HYDVU